MTDSETRLLDELAQHGILRRVEYVRTWMRRWNLTAGDPGHIDVDDPNSLYPERPLYVPKDHPDLADYYAKITAYVPR